MLPFAEKRWSFSSGGGDSAELFMWSIHTPMICIQQDKLSLVQNDAPPAGRELYTQEQWTLATQREWLGAQRAAHSNYCHYIQRRTRSNWSTLEELHITAPPTKDFQWGRWSQDYLPEVPVSMNLGNSYANLTYHLWIRHPLIHTAEPPPPKGKIKLHMCMYFGTRNTNIMIRRT